MPEFDQNVWENLKETCDKEIRPLPRGIIYGSDRSSEAIKVASANLSRLPFYDAVELSCKSFQQITQFEIAQTQIAKKLCAMDR